MKKQLDSGQKKHLRGLAHSLKPVVAIGNAGMHENLIREIDLTLKHHELIKIKVNASDHDARDKLIENVCESTGASLAQRIGHIAVIYRQSKDKKIIFPK